MDGNSVFPSFITWDLATTTFTFVDHTNSDRGEYLISITITDDDSEGAGEVKSATQTFIYKVVSINTAPVLSSKPYEDLTL